MAEAMNKLYKLYEADKKAYPFWNSLTKEEKEVVNGIAMQLPIGCEDVAKIFVLHGNSDKETTKRYMLIKHGVIVE